MSVPAELAECYADPIWRLNNIYWIRAKNGEAIPFVPRPEQQQVIESIFVNGWEHTIIPKARQLGMSTVIALIMLDTVLFNCGVQCTIVDKTATDAQKKLDEKIKYAYEHFDANFQAGWKVVTDNKGEWRVRQFGGDANDESFIFAGDKARGGTNQLLWISEWAHVKADMSDEILTGALPTAKHAGCYIINETTWKGGKAGNIWPFIVRSRAITEADKTAKDPRVLFYPWDIDPENRDYGHHSQITAATHEYFDQKERTNRAGTKFDNAQRLWWQKESDTQCIFMQREYPTDEEEAYTAPDEGTFFSPIGIGYQERCCTELESRLMYGNIRIIGEDEEELAIWTPCDRKQATYAVLELPQKNESYIAPADWSGQRMAAGATGERDMNAHGIIRAERMDPETGRTRKAQIVACLLPNDTNGTTATIRNLKALHRLYGDCMTAPETNNKDNICEQMESNGIRRIWSEQTGGDESVRARPGTVKRTEVKGFYTTEGTRRQILENLRDLVLNEEFILTFPWILNQFKAFIINEKGRCEAAPGEHDDFVMMTAIGLFCIGTATLFIERGLKGAKGRRIRNPQANELHPWDV